MWRFIEWSTDIRILQEFSIDNTVQYSLWTLDSGTHIKPDRTIIPIAAKRKPAKVIDFAQYIENKGL